MLDHDFWVTLQDGGQWATGRQGLCTSSCVCGPKRPLNTSGTEQDAGFAQEDLTIYDRRDKTEEWRDRVLTHWLLLHPSVSMLCVNNPKCTTWTPPSLFPLSAALEHPRGDFPWHKRTCEVIARAGCRQRPNGCLWGANRRDCWSSLSAPVRSDIKWSNPSDTMDK